MIAAKTCCSDAEGNEVTQARTTRRARRAAASRYDGRRPRVDPFTSTACAGARARLGIKDVKGAGCAYNGHDLDARDAARADRENRRTSRSAPAACAITPEDRGGAKPHRLRRGDPGGRRPQLRAQPVNRALKAKRTSGAGDPFLYTHALSRVCRTKYHAAYDGHTNGSNQAPLIRGLVARNYDARYMGNVPVRTGRDR